jgi:hypothetical protein
MQKERSAGRSGSEHPNEEVELLTTELRIENKRFYFNLKENQKGRFLKIAEVSGGRSTIIIPQSGWNDFRNMLDDFINGKAS